MSKKIYANMGVKSSVMTSTIQPAALKLSKLHFDTLKVKYKNGPISFVVLGISFVFPMCFGPDEDHQEIKRNFRNLLFIYMVMTSTQKINKICILDFLINTNGGVHSLIENE